MEVYGGVWNIVHHCGLAWAAMEAYGAVWMAVDGYGGVWNIAHHCGQAWRASYI